MTPSAVFSLVEGSHGKILLLLELTGFFNKQVRMAALAVKLFAEVEFVFKNNGPNRFYKNYRPATIFLHLGGELDLHRGQQNDNC